MTTGFDFSRTPEQRRRARELRFYRQAAGAALLGVMLAAGPALRMLAHTSGLEEANRLLAAQLQALQPRLDQAAAARQHIAGLRTRLAALDAQSERRMQAARMLGATATATVPDTRLYRIAIRTGDAELRGRAAGTPQVLAFSAALAEAGLDGVAIRDLRANDQSGGEDDERYDFSLSIPLARTIRLAEAGEATR
ncbi:MAG: hypothetical protein GAK35_00517 [Herbaspirillum frisingense]|uniref:PilN domain-containing protein n=1 Tax=Herbaspirillum frisingense TaxID=92645 RepID=A0A7V8FZS0_9BURK|nr:MAG: hypothetical protein GAK35_00517 [Herbaspirillum frisingense]